MEKKPKQNQNTVKNGVPQNCTKINEVNIFHFRFFMFLYLNFAFLKRVKSECRKREKLKDKYVLKIEFLKTETKINDKKK